VIQQRAEQLVSQVKIRPLPSHAHSRMKDAIRSVDMNTSFESFKQRFFMLDLFPESRRRTFGLDALMRARLRRCLLTMGREYSGRDPLKIRIEVEVQDASVRVIDVVALLAASRWCLIASREADLLRVGAKQPGFPRIAERRSRTPGHRCSLALRPPNRPEFVSANDFAKS
jgi:hypothetical protein